MPLHPQSSLQQQFSLHPQSRALLDIVHRPNAPLFHTLPIEKARIESQKMYFAGRPDAPEVAEVRDIVAERAEAAGGPLKMRLYRPLGAEDHEALPALLWYHGGGWTIGDIASYDVVCRQLANAADCAVVSVAYRLGPEHKFPAAPTDTYFALRWLADNADRWGIDSTRLAVGGDSAGGNLAAVTSLQALEAGGPDLRLQLLIYPATDQTSKRESHTRFGEGYLLTQATIRHFQACYLDGDTDRLDWRASPLLAPSVAGLPPARVIVAECDPVVDDCLAYAQRLEASGVPVVYSSYAGMVHGFFAWGRWFSDAVRAIAESAQALRDAFA
jgi:acetyl esterase